MRLKNILTGPCNIEVRTNGPEGEDIMFGACEWTGNELLSLDGDTYSLEDPVIAYVRDDEGNTICWDYYPCWTGPNGKEKIDCRDIFLSNIINRWGTKGLVILKDTYEYDM